MPIHLPTIAVPTGILLSPFKTKIEKSLLLETYITSHLEYMSRDCFLVDWKPIGANLEVSLHLPSVLDNDRVPMAKIAVRCKNSDESLDCVCLLIEAESIFGTHQGNVKLFRVGSKPVITALPSIPLRSFHITEDFKFFDSMTQLRIYILASGSSQLPATAQNYSDYVTSPNTIDLLNDRFVERWGTYWNMAAIDSSIRQRTHWLTRHLVSPKVIYGPDSKVPIMARVRAVFRAAIGRPLFWLLNREWLLKACFWVPIWFGKKFEIKENA